MKKMISLLIMILGINLTLFAQKNVKQMDKYILSLDSIVYTDTLVYKDSLNNGSIGFKYSIESNYLYFNLIKLNFNLESKIERIEEIYYFKDNKLIFVEINEYKYNQHINTFNLYYIKNKYIVLYDGTKFKLSETELNELLKSINEDILFYKKLVK